ncbi:MAG: tRNA (adenosine(37)-N6)-threonylcarbamoyltransferase complex ATPase subunit type 1 TsaE [Candidatus Nealsonbacteria bacterium CG_4_9_14_3_um_filter_35_11]|uniref:tRNA threonylcarbamoyladenosine biosynthesis protein TsaE n=2 Tax=Candidatus Nealsoniibacteriota TaxID=1817911 RepID=A0A2M7DAZ3_9BACT|nr:MAG: tRNA (adenosine(37)-N6)-threonylcarbamoyltransferase complex ATPase subunit type 1 TsaE [Candidatus Nealsonbacteria bacterium CG11_big_fil_rev_8_21_14_0_20_35_11]PIV45626.1 MAG: tRNA (adenosine(37)-N6)-threonylcarbamoyltransferase complex ATPase subunit type 1 TsaE [Candidatus Nealsonbacteria bacterium CG02_land_8_20_14_3_00_34_20]PIW92411.1 MAG: tRNA (adenosine(37)-N6)-threonylcarbamoyltransferase complex ATPase subunit type 1 TsaE [Candidatus Nealsonbacteria bacterium CG_4_8_14_3_um_fil
MKNKYITHSIFQTKNLGKKLAKRVLNQQVKNQAVVLALVGELGGGKTTFLQGFAKGLGIKEKILSPTFVIMKRFKIKDGRFKNFYHFDCYRIQKEKEILDLGFGQVVSNPQNIVAAEWAERAQKIVPKNAIWIKFEFIDEKRRDITVKTKNQK